MARRPSAQFYFADWRSNAKLRRCSRAARGDWVDVLGVLHDEDEYGIARYPLKELAQAAGVPMSGIRELVAKGVLKGSDTRLDYDFTYTPKSGRKEGETVILIPKQDGPIWFSSRFVRDEYIRNNRAQGGAQSAAKGGAPKVPNGETIGPCARAQSSSSSTSLEEDDDRRTRIETLISHTCDQLKIAAPQNTDYFQWFRALDALVDDGFDDVQIKQAVEIARQKGSRSINFVVACVRNPPKPHATASPNKWQDGRSEEDQRKAVLT